MKMLAGISISLITLFFITVLNKHVLQTPISDYLSGHICASAFWLTLILSNRN